MDQNSQQRMDALTEANVRLVRRVGELEERVRQLESRLDIPIEPDRRETEPRVEPVAQGEESPFAGPVVEPPRQPHVKPQGVETRIGLTWVNRIAVVTCILAVAFFFKYVADNEWVGPGGRVGLGVIGGVALLGTADFLWRRAHQVYAQGLCGLAIAVLYLSFHASFSFYQLLSQSAAFAAMVVVTATSGMAALRYRSQTIALLGLLGGYATPVLLSTGERRVWFLLSYIFLLNAGAIATARARHWRGLPWLALVGTVLLFGGSLEQPLTDADRLPFGVFALLYWALFGAAANALVFPLAHFFSGMAAVVIWDQRPASFVAVSLFLVAGLLVVADWKQWARAPLVAFGTFAVSFGLWIAEYPGQPPLLAELVLLVLSFCVFLGWAPWRIAVRAARLDPVELAVIVFNAAIFYGRLYTLLQQHEYAQLQGLSAVGLAAVHLAVAGWLWRRQQPEAADRRPVLLMIGIALAFLTLAAPIQFTGYGVSMAWALEGAALAWIAKRTSSRAMGIGALLAFVLTFVRLFSVDAWMYATPDYPTLRNTRMLTFFIAAASMFLASRWLAGVLKTRAALPVYTSSHFVFLWGLGLEVMGWAARIATPENRRSVESASISILIAGYAVALAAAGIATRTVVNRIFGLALIGFVVVKLYVYDVWQLGLIYRVMAFAGLGGLLLVMSYLYSRYRASVELWLQREKQKDADHPN